MAHDASGPVLPVSLRSGALRRVAWLKGAWRGAGARRQRKLLFAEDQARGVGVGAASGLRGRGKETPSSLPLRPTSQSLSALTSPPHSHVPTLRPTFPCYPMPPSHTLRHMIFASSPLRPTFHQHHVPLPHQPSFCFCLFLWGLILLGDFAGSMRPCGGKTLKCHGNVS